MIKEKECDSYLDFWNKKISKVLSKKFQDATNSLKIDALKSETLKSVISGNSPVRKNKSHLRTSLNSSLVKSTDSKGLTTLRSQAPSRAKQNDEIGHTITESEEVIKEPDGKHLCDLLPGHYFGSNALEYDLENMAIKQGKKLRQGTLFCKEGPVTLIRITAEACTEMLKEF
jgi:hypothetical protein